VGAGEVLLMVVVVAATLLYKSCRSSDYQAQRPIERDTKKEKKKRRKRLHLESV